MTHVDDAPYSHPVSQLGAELLDALRSHLPKSQVTYATTLPPSPARWAAWPGWILPELRAYLEDSGISRLYSHQVECASLAWEGRHVVVSTGTSSGKSLGYQLPVLSALASEPLACALYLTPTKALGSDQLAAATRFTSSLPSLHTVHPAPYDGDTPMESRRPIRDRCRLLFSNPDMLHAGILPNHQQWGRFLRHLRYVVVDECHSYRGVFGAHVALILRRLRRMARRYGASPTFIFASATAAEPGEHASRLLGETVAEVTSDGAPSGARTVVLWEPGFVEGPRGENGAPLRRAATTEAASIMAALIGEGARTLTFVRSRRGAEVVALRTAEELSGMGRFEESRRVASYRAGYLAEDRRRLEHELDDGTLLGVATTSALELGIDVGALDAVVTAGFPGTVASFWQQAGRAGRRGQGSTVVLVARDDPLDTYLVHHPPALLGRPLERSVFDPHNPHVLRDHLYCAAVEAPLSAHDVRAFRGEKVVTELESEGLLRHRPTGWFAVPQAPDAEGLRPENAHAQVAVRGGAARDILIADATDGRLLGTVGEDRAPAQVHPGAVYLHQGESFVIDDLDLEQGIALAHPEEPDYSTQPRSTTSIEILREPPPHHHMSPHPGFSVRCVDVEVTSRVTEYVERLRDGSIAAHVPLDMPAQVLRTRAVAYTVDPLVLDALDIPPDRIPGALHAAEHAAIGLLPLIATCDRWDIGGVSTALHPDTELPTVFVHDGHPGGAGFADCGFRLFPQWMRATFDAVRSCACEEGCPSCVQSPKCGNGNQPLDKAGAVALLGAIVSMVEGAPWNPAPRVS